MIPVTRRARSWPYHTVGDEELVAVHAVGEVAIVVEQSRFNVSYAKLIVSPARVVRLSMLSLAS